MMAVQIGLLCGVVVFSLLAVLLRDILKAAISLAAASLLLGILFFRMNAPYAGAFEISVVAGLITVLFIVTIALTKSEGDVRESKLAAWIFPLFFAVFLAVDFLVMRRLLGQIASAPAPAEAGTFGQVLWQGRSFDLIAQVGVIFAGVFAVLALFRKRSKHD
jgi:NADH:ubiquinone oxidoreductase subunit 6 (subunit J)